MAKAVLTWLQNLHDKWILRRNHSYKEQGEFFEVMKAITATKNKDNSFPTEWLMRTGLHKASPVGGLQPFLEFSPYFVTLLIVASLFQGRWWQKQACQLSFAVSHVCTDIACSCTTGNVIMWVRPYQTGQPGGKETRTSGDRLECVFRHLSDSRQLLSARTATTAPLRRWYLRNMFLFHCRSTHAGPSLFNFSHTAFIASKKK